MRTLPDLHANEYKRFTFYFPKGDEVSIEDYIVTPDHKKPGEVKDLHFKFCGQKLKRSAEFTRFVENEVPAKFRDRFSKSEKGIDIEICCDGFKLAAASRLDRLFLLTNDDDFIPFCRTIKEYGANVSIIHLTDLLVPNLSLLREADSYDVVRKDQLQSLFLPLPGQSAAAGEAAELPFEEPVAEAVSVLKPDAEPSDLVVDSADAGVGEEIAVDDSASAIEATVEPSDVAIDADSEEVSSEDD